MGIQTKVKFFTVADGAVWNGSSEIPELFFVQHWQQVHLGTSFRFTSNNLGQFDVIGWNLSHQRETRAASLLQEIFQQF